MVLESACRSFAMKLLWICQVVVCIVFAEEQNFGYDSLTIDVIILLVSELHDYLCNINISYANFLPYYSCRSAAGTFKVMQDVFGSTLTWATQSFGITEQCPYVDDPVLSLAHHLPASISGQDQGVEMILDTFSSWEFSRKAGYQQPLVLAITGPTGVGKSETGFIIAEAILAMKARIGVSRRHLPEGYLVLHHSTTHMTHYSYVIQTTPTLCFKKRDTVQHDTMVNTCYIYYSIHISMLYTRKSTGPCFISNIIQHSGPGTGLKSSSPGCWISCTCSHLAPGPLRVELVCTT